VQIVEYADSDGIIPFEVPQLEDNSDLAVYPCDLRLRVWLNKFLDKAVIRLELVRSLFAATHDDELDG